jgi:hypothetical protein
MLQEFGFLDFQKGLQKGVKASFGLLDSSLETRHSRDPLQPGNEITDQQR